MHRAFVPAMAFLALTALSLSSQAQVYRYTDENGITVLTNIKPEPGRYENVRNVGCYGTCIKGVDWHATPLKRVEYRDEVRAAAEVHGVDEASGRGERLERLRKRGRCAPRVLPTVARPVRTESTLY